MRSAPLGALLLLAGCALFQSAPTQTAGETLDAFVARQEAYNKARVEANAALQGTASAIGAVIPPPWNLLVPLAVGGVQLAGIIVSGGAKAKPKP